MSGAIETLTIMALAGAGLNAGVFISYSTFTMQGLKRLAPAQGAAAMQAINEEAPKPPLMLLMFGTAAVSVALMVNAAGSIDESASGYQLVAGGLYVAGVIFMTGLYHVHATTGSTASVPAAPRGPPTGPSTFGSGCG